MTTSNQNPAATAPTQAGQVPDLTKSAGQPAKTRWQATPPGDTQTVRQLASELNISPVLANLLVQRGINTFEEARAFFSPDIDDLHDPYEMKDMEQAVTRVLQALTNNERILIYGDYDVDGTTSVAMLLSFLSQPAHSSEHFTRISHHHWDSRNFQGPNPSPFPTLVE